MRLQLVVITGESVRAIDLPERGTLAVGRAENSDVLIDDPSVSRNHALLHVGIGLTIEDLGSANGTLVRDRASPTPTGDTLNIRQLVGRKAELAVGDAMLFGTASVIVRHAPSETVPDLDVSSEGAVMGDPAMRALYAQAARVAPLPIDVLILGETGVGKELLARTIHARSSRAEGPFVPVNCGAFSESLIDSELFGHEKGAFTGAAQAHTGVFESAAGGTLLLDEVGELSAATQVRLLRVLEERMVKRLGSSRPRPIDVRVLAATNRDLQAESGVGRFRSDLYFRLAKVTLSIPPLRERQGEIGALAFSLLTAACKLIERTPVPTLSPAVSAFLLRHDWKGNVRELKNTMEYVAALCPADTVQLEHLPPSMRAKPRAPAAPPPVAATTDLPAAIRDLERARIVAALEEHRGNRSKAARALGIARRTLLSRIEEYGLPGPRKPEDDSED